MKKSIALITAVALLFIGLISSNAVLAAETATISLGGKTDTTLTFNVTYPQQNVWGNRLQLLNMATGEWTQIAPDFSLNNGTFTFTNLVPGTDYRASLSWYDTEWHDIYSSAKTAEATVSLVRRTDTSLTFKVTYPQQDVWGNRLQLLNMSTGEWTQIAPDFSLNDGTYTFNGLSCGTNYRASLSWYDTDWHDIYSYANTVDSTGFSRVIVLVHESVFDGLQDSLDQYKADLLDQGYAASVYNYSNGDASAVRGLVKDIYDVEGNVKSLFLIGDIPYAEVMNNWEPTYSDNGMSDLYYMDLDGEWLNTDNDAAFEEHNNGSGDRAPEISCGRLYASSLTGAGRSELDLYKNYFNRNHLYRTNSIPRSGALISYENGAVQSEVDSLKELYSNTTAIDCQNNNTVLQNEITKNYEWASIIAHSWSSTLGGLTPNFIRTNMPRALFYNTHACGSARYIDIDYVAGTCIFEANGLTYLGSTTLAYYPPEWDKAYTSKLANGGTFGDALVDLFNLAVNNDTSLKWTGQEMILLGDPTLKVAQ